MNELKWQVFIETQFDNIFLLLKPLVSRRITLRWYGWTDCVRLTVDSGGVSFERLVANDVSLKRRTEASQILSLAMCALLFDAAIYSKPLLVLGNPSALPSYHPRNHQVNKLLDQYLASGRTRFTQSRCAKTTGKKETVLAFFPERSDLQASHRFFGSLRLRWNTENSQNSTFAREARQALVVE